MIYPRPNNNTYWVEPGQLLAGEYPGALTADLALVRINQFLDCGINYFIDLTQENELQAYSDLLIKAAAERGINVVHKRFAIADKGVPTSSAQMQEILSSLRDGLKDGRHVYVHCWGGIGRTGTVIGCYLAENYADTDRALKTLVSLWPQMEKSTRRPRTPETDEQFAWIKNWLAQKI